MPTKQLSTLELVKDFYKSIGSSICGLINSTDLEIIPEFRLFEVPEDDENFLHVHEDLGKITQGSYSSEIINEFGKIKVFYNATNAYANKPLVLYAPQCGRAIIVNPEALNAASQVLLELQNV